MANASVEIDKEVLADIELLANRNGKEVPEVIRAAVRVFAILLFKGDEAQFELFKKQQQIAAHQAKTEPATEAVA